MPNYSIQLVEIAARVQESLKCITVLRPAQSFITQIPAMQTYNLHETLS